MRRARTAAALLVVALASSSLATGAAAAGPPGADACADTAERAQALRRRGRLLDARAALRECSRATCPRVVRDDCTTWEVQVDAAIPTLSVAVKDDAGQDVVDATIAIDGVPPASARAGLAVAEDPGEHVVRVERAGATAARTIVLHEGEKNRVVEVRLPVAVPAGPPRGASEPAATSASSSPPPIVFVAGGVGIAALAGFAVLGVTGLDTYHALHDECGTTRACSSAEIDRNRAQLWIADGLGVLGVAALGAAAWLWIDAGSRRVGVAPTPGGVVARGSF